MRFYTLTHCPKGDESKARTATINGAHIVEVLAAPVNPGFARVDLADGRQLLVKATKAAVLATLDADVVNVTFEPPSVTPKTAKDIVAELTNPKKPRKKDR